MLKATFREFLDDDCPRMAAALSYYTIFALPPLLLLLITLAGAVWDPQDIQGSIAREVDGLVGPGAAEQVRTMIANVDRPGSGGVMATILGIAGLLFGATGAFGQLQQALNNAWEVEPDPEKGGIRRFLVKRVFSFGMILVVAFLLLVSLVLGAALSAFGDALGGFLPGDLSGALLQGLQAAVSLALITLLFAAIFKVLPDARIEWRDVWIGALVTALLFVAGKFLIGFYLGRSDPGSAFGAAGSLAVLLVWVYFSAMILFLGVEFTQVWARRKGKGILPDDDAVAVVKEKRHLRGDTA